MDLIMEKTSGKLKTLGDQAGVKMVILDSPELKNLLVKNVVSYKMPHTQLFDLYLYLKKSYKKPKSLFY